MNNIGIGVYGISISASGYSIGIGLVYGGLTPQQQPGSYRGGDDDDEMSVSLVEETGAPGGNHQPTTSNRVLVSVSVYNIFVILCQSLSYVSVSLLLVSVSLLLVSVSIILVSVSIILVSVSIILVSGGSLC